MNPVMDLALNFSGSFCPQVQNFRGQSTKLKGQEIKMKIIGECVKSHRTTKRFMH